MGLGNLKVRLPTDSTVMSLHWSPIELHMRKPWASNSFRCAVLYSTAVKPASSGDLVSSDDE
jgi:hypothetical protein